MENSLIDRVFKNKEERDYILNRHNISENGDCWDNLENKKINNNKGPGYYTLNLNFHREKRKFYTHRLIAHIYCPNPRGYHVVNHIDGNRLNNHYSNLEWCSQRQNTSHGKGKMKYKGIPIKVRKSTYDKIIASGIDLNEIDGDSFFLKHLSLYKWCLAAWVDNAPGEKPDVLEYFRTKDEVLEFVAKNNLDNFSIRIWEEK